MFSEYELVNILRCVQIVGHDKNLIKRCEEELRLAEETRLPEEAHHPERYSTDDAGEAR
jgi:hypothetical protein